MRIQTQSCSFPRVWDFQTVPIRWSRTQVKSALIPSKIPVYPFLLSRENTGLENPKELLEGIKGMLKILGKLDFIHVFYRTGCRQSLSCEHRKIPGTWVKPAGIALGMGREKLDPTPGVSRGGSWAESSRTFHGISAPGAVENLWKRTFLLGKKYFWDKLGFQRNFWESRAAFYFVFSQEKCGFWLF